MYGAPVSPRPPWHLRPPKEDRWWIPPPSSTGWSTASTATTPRRWPPATRPTPGSIPPAGRRRRHRDLAGRRSRHLHHLSRPSAPPAQPGRRRPGGTPGSQDDRHQHRPVPLSETERLLLGTQAETLPATGTRHRHHRPRRAVGQHPAH